MEESTYIVLTFAYTQSGEVHLLLPGEVRDNEMFGEEHFTEVPFTPNEKEMPSDFMEYVLLMLQSENITGLYAIRGALQAAFHLGQKNPLGQH